MPVIRNPLQSLPARKDGSCWPHQVQTLYATVFADYSSAKEVFFEDDSDSIRLRYHSSRLLCRTLPYLAVIGNEMPHMCYTKWFNRIVAEVQGLVICLNARADTENTM